MSNFAPGFGMTSFFGKRQFSFFGLLKYFFGANDKIKKLFREICK